MKIDKSAIYKKIGFVLVLFSFLSIVETVVSKAISKIGVTTIQQSPISPIVKEKVVPEIPRSVIEQPSFVKTTNDKFLPDKLSLEQIHALSQEQNKRVVKSDKFTQSQAHMSLPEIKKVIAAHYNTKPYQKIIDAILTREVEYKNNYYVFYHGMNNKWRIPQDLYTRLYLYVKGLPSDVLQSFVFLRFDGVLDFSGNTEDFLIKKLKENGLVNDHDLEEVMYSVNIALFGNVGDDPECTWQYFMKARNKTEPTRQTYEKILNIFGLPHTYINELMSLSSFFTTTEQTIVQIFVPQDKVDQIGYLAWVRGNPAYKPMMDMISRSLKDKKFAKSSLAMDYYTTLFKKEQEINPVFKSLVERVRAGDFTLRYFLKFYRNYPGLIADINRYQARLIFTPDVLLNPLSGVKIFRYSVATTQQLQKYHQKFDEIFKKITAERSLKFRNNK
ncbi:MAG TPA: hypothetical protein VHX42_03430 [Candidatus Babeliales bacterium]|nr:hypothetical protein [Candidatus Babeliales bacterium]